MSFWENGWPRREPTSERQRLLWAVALAVAAAAVVAACVTNPVTGKSEMSLVSEEEEKQLGAQAYGPMIQQSYGAVNDPELQAYVQRVGAGLAAVSHRPAMDYRYTVVNANYDNAFALPGGKVCITRGLLARMTSEDQLAGVLGHETGHVTARHGAAGMTRAMLTQGMLGLGAVVLEAKEVRGAGLIVGAAGLGAQLVLLRYTRDQERQADELGMEYMVTAGYNPSGFVESMEILAAAHEREPGKLEAMFQSHPVTSERIATGKDRVQTLYSGAAGRPSRRDELGRRTARLREEIPAFKLADEGERALKEKDYRTAVAKLDEASRLAPRQAILPALRGVVQLESRDFRAAQESGRQASRIDPELFHGRLVSGVAAYRLGGYRESLDDLLAAEKSAGPTLLSTYVLGRDYEALGERDEAAKRFRTVVQNSESGEERDYSLSRLREWGQLTP